MSSVGGYVMIRIFIIFSTYVGVKFEQTYTVLYFHKFAYTRRDVSCFIERTNFSGFLPSRVL